MNFVLFLRLHEYNLINDELKNRIMNKSIKLILLTYLEQI